MNFKGRVALVTGAASGIGKATAMTFAQNGATVVIVDMEEEKLNNVKKEIELAGGKVLSYVCDVSDEDRVNEVCLDALKKLGKIDILVNNAAIFRTWDDFLTVSTDTWRKYINVNVMGVVYFTKALLPQMVEKQVW